MTHSNKVAGKTATKGSARPDHRGEVIIIGEVDDPSRNSLTLNGGAIVHLHLGKPVTDSLAISR